MLPFLPSRLSGAVVGGAIGDVIGGVVERGSLTLSDDTQLTLATCEAIIGSGGSVDPAAIAARMLAWFRERRITGIGSSTLKAMRDLDAGAHWALAGARGERAGGNGAAMRIAPLAFLLDPAVPAERTAIRDVARITHHHEEAYAGALAVVVAIRHAARGRLAELEAIANELPDTRVRDNLLALSGRGNMAPAEIAATIGASGFAAESVPFAIAVAPRMLGGAFEATLHEINAAGGDTDTIGSIAGQIAGAALGEDSLPIHLLAGVPAADLVFTTAARFAALTTDD